MAILFFATFCCALPGQCHGASAQNDVAVVPTFLARANVARIIQQVSELETFEAVSSCAKRLTGFRLSAAPMFFDLLTRLLLAQRVPGAGRTAAGHEISKTNSIFVPLATVPLATALHRLRRNVVIAR